MLVTSWWKTFPTHRQKQTWTGKHTAQHCLNFATYRVIQYSFEIPKKKQSNFLFCALLSLLWCFSLSVSSLWEHCEGCLVLFPLSVFALYSVSVNVYCELSTYSHTDCNINDMCIFHGKNTVHIYYMSVRIQNLSREVTRMLLIKLFLGSYLLKINV